MKEVSLVLAQSGCSKCFRHHEVFSGESLCELLVLQRLSEVLVNVADASA